MKHTFSPTQIETFDVEGNPKSSCNRKWGFLKLDKLPAPPNASAQRGVEIHHEMEVVQTSNVLPSMDHKYANVVRGMAKHIPPMHETTKLEYKFHLDIGVAILHGIMDRIDVLPKLIVYDFKSKSDLKWALTEKQLRQDTQANVYALAGMKINQRQEIDLRWINGEVKSGKTLPVDVTIGLTKAEDFISKKLPTIARMSGAKDKGLKGMDLEPNFKACGAYGGCPFRMTCGLKPLEWIGAQFMAASLLDDLRAEVGAPGAVGVNAPEGARGGGLLGQINSTPASQPAQPFNQPSLFNQAQTTPAAPSSLATTYTAAALQGLIAAAGTNAFNKALVAELVDLASAYGKAQAAKN